MLPRQIYRTAILILALAMTGCASIPGRDKGNAENNAEYQELYNGEMEVAHEARQQEATAEELIANGDRALAIGNTDQAMYEYVHALELSGGDAGTLNKIGAIHVALGNFQLAARAYTFSLRLDADNAVAHEGIGLLLMRDRHYEEAENYLTAALVAEPQRWQSHNGLGMLADLEGDHATAANYFQQALDTLPGTSGRTDKARVLNNLGYSIYMSGDRESALPYFYKALDSNPEFDRAWQNIGLVYTMTGHYNRALDAYMHVMEKPAANNNVGYLCMLNNNYDQAEYFFRQAIKLSPSYYVKAHDNLDRLNILR